jgi:hypothetical protein
MAPASGQAPQGEPTRPHSQPRKPKRRARSGLPDRGKCDAQGQTPRLQSLRQEAQREPDRPCKLPTRREPRSCIASVSFARTPGRAAGPPNTTMNLAKPGWRPRSTCGQAAEKDCAPSAGGHYSPSLPFHGLASRQIDPKSYPADGLPATATTCARAEIPESTLLQKFAWETECAYRYTNLEKGFASGIGPDAEEAC